MRAQYMAREDVIKINGKSFVTVNALSHLLRRHKRTVQLWAKEHQIPLIRVGNLMLFDLDDITEWLHKHKYNPAT